MHEMEYIMMDVPTFLALGFGGGWLFGLIIEDRFECIGISYTFCVNPS